VSKSTAHEFDIYAERLKVPAYGGDVSVYSVGHLGTIAEVEFLLIDDLMVRNELDIDFCMGSNFAHASYIVPETIWIAKSLVPEDMFPTCVHEFVESWLMANHAMKYDDAHDHANVFETKMREAGANTFDDAGAMIRIFLNTV
jgi:hypothetical protein